MILTLTCGMRACVCIHNCAVLCVKVLDKVYTRCNIHNRLCQPVIGVMRKPSFVVNSAINCRQEFTLRFVVCNIVDVLIIPG